MSGRGKRPDTPQQLDLPFLAVGNQSAKNQQAPIAVRISQATKMVGLGRSKLYELIASGEVETFKIGRCTLIPVESLHKLVERARESKT